MDNSHHFLVTGAMGCIGAWVTKLLDQEGSLVTALDASTDDHRLRLICHPDAFDRIHIIQGDITDLDALQRMMKKEGIDHIVHLAALQVPFCKADPTLGARVNVVGTVNVFEAARRLGINHLAYASSVGVFGLSEEYPGGVVTDDSNPRPRTLYGVYKQANEATARVYWWDYGISSVGLRPYVVYGPGRDQGMTSGPTWAMLAAAAGRAYRIPYGGRSGFNYVEDIARTFIRAARLEVGDARVFNVSGGIVDMPDLLEAIFQAAPEARGKIEYISQHLPLPDGMQDSAIQEVMPDLITTPIQEGVARTIAHFRQALRDGRIQASLLPE